MVVVNCVNKGLIFAPKGVNPALEIWGPGTVDPFAWLVIHPFFFFVLENS